MPDYADDCVLLMDIRKYGADAEVVAPNELYKAAEKSLEQAVSQYRCGQTTGSGFEPWDK